MAVEQVDLVQVGLHMRRVEVSAHLLIVVLWKAQTKHQLNVHRRNVGSRGREGSESWLCADCAVLALSSSLSSHSFVALLWDSPTLPRVCLANCPRVFVSNFKQVKTEHGRNSEHSSASPVWGRAVIFCTAPPMLFACLPTFFFSTSSLQESIYKSKFFFLYLVVTFDHFQILRAIGKGSFGKVGLDTQL